MKVLYLTNCSIKSFSGVSKKILFQCKAIEKMSHEVDLVTIQNNTVKIIDLKNTNDDYSFNIKNKKDTVIHKIFLKTGLLFAINGLDKLNNYDIIYIRRLVPLAPSYLSFIKKIKKSSKVYYEIPTYPYLKEHMCLSFKNLYELPLEFRAIERLKTVVDEFVVVTEIQDEKARKRLGKFKIIPNGFDVSSVSVRTAPALDKEVHILGLANLAFWHGYDRIITGMSQYKGSYKIIFHIVGGTGYSEIQKLRNLSLHLGVSDSVEFYEPLYGERLSVLFDKCHIAAGTLALHRIGSMNGSVLKLREYCARGMPFFYGYNDEDFDNFDFSLRFTADDSPVDIDAVSKFVEELYSKSNNESKMREYAAENLDWTSKMKRLFE